MLQDQFQNTENFIYFLKYISLLILQSTSSILLPRANLFSVVIASCVIHLLWLYYLNQKY